MEGGGTSFSFNDDPNDKNSMKYLDFEKANIFQKQFASVFTEESPGPSTINNFTRSCLEKLDSLDTNKSIGTDNIHPMLLRRLANKLRHLSHKFQIRIS